MKVIFVAAVAACAVALGAGSQSANATTITFGTYSGPDDFEYLGPSYIESGFNFANSGGFMRWQNGTLNDSDPTASTGLVTYMSFTTTVMSRVDGGAFDFLSLDVDDAFNVGSPHGLLSYEYGLHGGGTGSGSFLVDDVGGFSTVLLNLANLAYFSFTPSQDLFWVTFDNVQISENVVPIPATLPLFASALAALGWVARRRIGGGSALLPRFA
jgi:hypothetical protein